MKNKSIRWKDRDSEIKNTSLVLTSNVIAQGINFIIVMLITRALTVEDYAKFALLNTILSLVVDLADMGMNGAVTRFVAQLHSMDGISEIKLIAYVIRRKLLNSAFVICVLLALSNVIARTFIHDETYTVYVALTSFCVGFSLLSSLNKAIFQGREHYTKYFISAVFDIGVYLAIILVIYVNNCLSVPTILIAMLGRLIVSAVFSAYLAGVGLKTLLQTVEKNDPIRKKFNNFGNWMLLWAIFANLQSRADMLLLSQLTTSDQVSYYDVANKFTKPILMVVSSYAQVLNPLLVRLLEEGNVKGKLSKIIRFIFVITIGLVLCTVLCGPAIRLLFGTKYIESIAPLRIMLLSLVFYVWTVPYNSMLYAYNKPYVFAIAAGIGLVATLIGDYAFLGRYGAIGASYTYCLAQIISLLVAVVAYRKISKKIEQNK